MADAGHVTSSTVGRAAEGEDFRSIPALPRAAELKAPPPCPPQPYMLEGAYASAQAYLDTHFRLLREDFIAPLRDGVQQYLINPRIGRYGDVRIHRQVQFLNYVVTRDVAGLEIKLLGKQTGSKTRFSRGSLLCFTDDDFSSVFFATVADSTGVAAGRLTVALQSCNSSADLLGRSYLMLESAVPLMPYYEVLMHLQKKSLAGHFPMEKYIVDFRECGVPPAHWAVTPEAQVPAAADVGLEDSQYQAYSKALASEFACIQGAPGTGKTLVGLKLARTIIERALPGRLLVVCANDYTLDRFLAELLPATDKLVRIGGPCQHDTLLAHDISVLREPHMELYGAEFDAKTQAINTMSAMLAEIDSCEGIFDIAPFKCEDGAAQRITQFLAPFALNNFATPLVNWLLLRDETAEMKAKLNKYCQGSRCLPPAGHGEVEGQEGGAAQPLEPAEYPLYMQAHDKYYTLQALQVEVDNATDEAARKCLEYNKYHLAYRLERGSRGYAAVTWSEKAAGGFSAEQRWALYWQWSRGVHARLKTLLAQEVLDMAAMQKERRAIVDQRLLQAADVVGVTGAAAAGLLQVLHAAGAATVIVDEAGELPEPQIVSLLTAGCQQLILIGDARQQNPLDAAHRLALQERLDITLMSRLSRHCLELDVQYRMRPGLNALLSAAGYPRLEIHLPLRATTPIKGMVDSLFFLEHEVPETVVNDGSSWENHHEASLVVSLARYLVQQGYEASDITMLTPHEGQLLALQEMKQKVPSLAATRASMLSDFRGQESRIVLLSMVRTSAAADEVLALSRAREGFYMMGNMELLSSCSPLWAAVRDELTSQAAIGPNLTLQCQRHPATQTPVKSHSQFSAVARGGCRNKCSDLLPCGHRCTLSCHIVDSQHEKYKCTFKCTRKLCDLGHPCPLLCHEPCQPCKQLVERTLACGHMKQLECHVDPAEETCHVMVHAVLLCKHQQEKPCYQKLEDVVCGHACTDRLDCGHACTRQCHKNDDPRHAEFKCMKRCARRHKDCPDDKHACAKLCSEECEPCVVLVPKVKTACGHTNEVQCHEDVEAVACMAVCDKIMACHHNCKMLCSVPCGGCTDETEKLRSCGHRLMVACNEDVDKKTCNEQCARVLGCSHVCPGTCEQRCEDFECPQMVKSDVPSLCGHDFLIPCRVGVTAPALKRLLMLALCPEPCGSVLKDCGHPCAGTCGSCVGGRLHASCAKPCGNPLVCGHICTNPCRFECPPCEEPCDVRCVHSACTLECDVPCRPCKEECPRRCEHGQCGQLCSAPCDWPPCSQDCPRPLPCGHPCRGLCGEQCPLVCIPCGQEPEMLFGTEDEDDARFILLLDCLHSIEVTSMDDWIETKYNVTDKSQVISMPRCPLCDKAIVNTPRYADVVKRSFNHIALAKVKVFGRIEDNEKTLAELRDVMAKVATEGEHMAQVARWTTILQSITKEVGPPGQGGHSILDANRFKVQLDVLNNISQLCKPLGKIPSELIKIQIDHILKATETCGKSVSPQESDELNNELRRLDRIILFVLITEHPNYKACLADTSYTDIVSTLEEDIITSIEPFNKTLYDEVGIKLTLIKDDLAINVNINEGDMKMVIAAIGLKQGHWYMCPNNHPYSIGECGQAMEQGTCPECKAPIGGGLHTLLTSNTALPGADIATGIITAAGR